MRMRPSRGDTWHFEVYDATAPLKGVEGLRETHPDWSLRVLPDGDHHSLLRDPEWTMREMRTFLATTNAAAGMMARQ